MEKVREKWVKNLSDRDLSTEEKSLLTRGLNFAVTPTALPTKDYVIGIETACKLIGPESSEAASLRADCVRLLKTQLFLSHTADIPISL